MPRGKQGTRVASFVANLICPRCSRQHDHRRPQGLCSCGSPLLVDYDLEALAAVTTKGDVSAGPPTMWRYRAFLPVKDPAEAVTLGEGFTPLLRSAALGDRIGLPHLWVKDEGPNPTGTFKARGAACGVSRARELGIDNVALATAGNAGGAWAAYGAAAGLPVHVAMPQDAPPANLWECRLYGAHVELVDGLVSDATGAVAAGAEQRGWFDASTLKEPYRIEGKKTLGLEIAEQLGWRWPEAIVYPAGGGVGLIGIWRALVQLREIGWVEGDLPRLIVAQAEGCAPLVHAFETGAEESEFWESPSTIASGLRVPKALGDFLVLRAVRETGGTAIAVSDDEIIGMVATFGSVGISAAPEGAATLAAAIRLRERGDLGPRDRVVLVNTGSAAKYEDAVRSAVDSRLGRRRGSDQTEPDPSGEDRLA